MMNGGIEWEKLRIHANDNFPDINSKRIADIMCYRLLQRVEDFFTAFFDDDNIFRPESNEERDWDAAFWAAVLMLMGRSIFVVG